MISITDVDRKPAAVAAVTSRASVAVPPSMRRASTNRKMAGMRTVNKVNCSASVITLAFNPPKVVYSIVIVTIDTTAGPSRMPKMSWTTTPPALAITAAKPAHRPTETIPARTWHVRLYLYPIASPSVWQSVSERSRGAMNMPTRIF